jgi:hypothetical protein
VSTPSQLFTIVSDFIKQEFPNVIIHGWDESFYKRYVKYESGDSFVEQIGWVDAEERIIGIGHGRIKAADPECFDKLKVAMTQVLK